MKMKNYLFLLQFFLTCRLRQECPVREKTVSVHQQRNKFLIYLDTVSWFNDFQHHNTSQRVVRLTISSGFHYKEIWVAWLCSSLRKENWKHWKGSSFSFRRRLFFSNVTLLHFAGSSRFYFSWNIDNISALIFNFIILYVHLIFHSYDRDQTNVFNFVKLIMVL